MPQRTTWLTYVSVTLYISEPSKKNARTKARAGIAVLMLTDVFGLALNENKLFVAPFTPSTSSPQRINTHPSLADSYARAGYLTIAPDMFAGNPAPGDINVPGFNTTEFLAQHGPEVTDPIIATTISYLRTKLGVKRIAAPGYCFGGRYAFRFLAGDGEGRVDVGFAAHPSLLEGAEISAIQGPVSVAAADNDNLFDADARFAAEKLLVAKPEKLAYEVHLYSGTEHGFGVRVDLSDPQQKYAKERAFLQAARWFDYSFGFEQ
jgi:dienelactone hydrolase